MTETFQPGDTVTAAILVIGDEILSGRTKDKNIGHIADVLTAMGIQLREVRIVPDEAAEIVAALNAIRARYDYVFTTGGIGPTHDDITADCVAEAFGVSIGVDERARAMLLERYKPEELTEARLRMARIPTGADLVPNAVSKAPGFRIGNVIVMAGVPSVMHAMLDTVAPTLRAGRKMLSTAIDAGALPEGIYGGPLAEIARAHPAVSIGSYPSFTGQGFRNQIVVRSTDQVAMETAAEAVRLALAGLQPDKVPA
jgi:molybdenum cofactor synthesis domain-containing protein